MFPASGFGTETGLGDIAGLLVSSAGIAGQTVGHYAKHWIANWRTAWCGRTRARLRPSSHLKRSEVDASRGQWRERQREARMM